MTSNAIQSAADNSLGSLIHDARLNAGFTFRALSEASGVAQGQISKLEKDQVLKQGSVKVAQAVIDLVFRGVTRRQQ